MTATTAAVLLEQLYHAPEDASLRNAVVDALLDDGDPARAECVRGGGLPGLAYLLTLIERVDDLSEALHFHAATGNYVSHRIMGEPTRLLLLADVSPEQDSRLEECDFVDAYSWAKWGPEISGDDRTLPDGDGVRYGVEVI